jgi:hypothetical protein
MSTTPTNKTAEQTAERVIITLPVTEKIAGKRVTLFNLNIDLTDVSLDELRQQTAGQIRRNFYNNNRPLATAPKRAAVWEGYKKAGSHLLDASVFLTETHRERVKDASDTVRALLAQGAAVDKQALQLAVAELNAERIALDALIASALK